MPGNQLARRPVPTIADWWMVGLTAAAAIGTVGALFAVLSASSRTRNAATRQLEAQRQDLDLARQSLEDERRARQAEIARIDAERRDAEARQARRVSTQPLRTGAGERGRGVRNVEFVVRNDSAGPVFDVVGELYMHHPDGPPTRLHGAHAVPRERIGPAESDRLIFVAAQGRLFLAGWKPDSENGPEFIADIAFTDEAGLRWHRRGTEQPVPALDDIPHDPR